MTPPLTHPPAEDLGRFVEGTLDDTSRTTIVAHIADCDECRMVVVDAAEFIEPVVVHSERKWWAAAAAALVVAAGIGVFIRDQHDPAVDLAAATTDLKTRPVEARLSGFPYSEWNPTRGGSTDAESSTTESAELHLEIAAGAVLERSGQDAKTLHAHGLAHLLIHDTTTAVTELTQAASKAPNTAHYWSDLAAARIANNEAAQALAASDKALAIDSKSPEALFNRAVALQWMHRKNDAIAAYKRYLAVDVSSPWRRDAQKGLAQVQE